MSRHFALLAALAPLLAAAFAPVGRAGGDTGAPPLAIVYVEPNTGGSSGGHMGLRVGRDIYHYQRTARGWFLLRRDGWKGFRTTYSGLENRGLHLAYLAIPEDARQRISARLATKLALQEADLARWRRLHEDLSWLAGMTCTGPPPKLAAAGFFAPFNQDDAHGMRLRERVLARIDPLVLQRRLTRIESRITEFARKMQRPADLETLRENLQEREALRVILDGSGLDPSAAISLSDEAPLTPGETALMARCAARLEQSLIQLLDAPRPDRGRALLVTAARWHVLQKSIETRRLMLLDSFPDDAMRYPADAIGTLRSRLALSQRAGKALRAARRAILSSPRLDESRLNVLEDAATRLAEARRAARGLPMRQSDTPMLPSRGRAVDLPRPNRNIQTDLDGTRAELRLFEDRLNRFYEYDLITSNCVTEIADLLRDAFPKPGEARQALGGEIPGSGPLDFVPSVFFSGVEEHWHIARLETMPSHRQEKMAEMARSEGNLAVSLREASPLTSRIYQPRARDGYFLFFTDGSAWSRPLLGVANLLFGTGVTVIGLPYALFDGGDLAVAGFNGITFSLPELVFVNIRKGTFDSLE